MYAALTAGAQRRESGEMIVPDTLLTTPALLAALALAPATKPATGEDVAVGRPYPQLVLPTLDGSRATSLADFRGQKVLLIEFASW